MGYAPFAEVLRVRCPGSPQHSHEPLQGFTVDFWGNQVWKTALAAEYPQGLCEELAKAYDEWVVCHPARDKEWELKLTEEQRSTDPWSKKRMIEEENDECIGGLRSPEASIQKVPGWKIVGKMLNNMLKCTVTECPELGKGHELIGEKTEGLPLGPLQWARDRWQRAWRCTPYPQKGIWSSLSVQLVRLSKDPDGWAASWPALGTPLGILEQIPFAGVFLKTEDGFKGTWDEKLRALGTLKGADDNYQSYNEEREAGEELFDKEIEKGFAEWSKDRRKLEGSYGPLVPSAMGLILKVKQDGTKKARLVHDLRRSRVNEFISCEERLVLPRIRDAEEDILLALESKRPGEKVEVWSLDFSDAFKQLPVRHQEKRFLSGITKGGYFVYHTVLFGIKTGPLVWGRTAALIARMTQGVLEKSRLQLYVDDPILSLRGTTEEIEAEMSRVTLLWSLLGLKIAFHKGTRGAVSEWVGAKIEVDNVANSLEISVPAEKIEEWLKLARSLKTEPLVSFKAVERFTGKMAWAAGFVLQLRPFVRMLHAAMTTSPDRDKIYFRQVKPALEWLEAYLLEQRGGVRKLTVAHERRVCRLDFYVDASPSGGGAVRLEGGRPVETFALTWTAEDEKVLGAKVGDPGSQALWEAYMMLRCLWHWMDGTSQGFIRIRGDAQGVLSAFVKRSAASPLLNLIVKEVALQLAIHHQTLEALHIWSETNLWADMLSRGECPEELRQLPRVMNARTNWHPW